MARPERHRIPVKTPPLLTPLQALWLQDAPSAPLTTAHQRKAKKAKRKQAAQSKARNQR